MLQIWRQVVKKTPIFSFLPYICHLEIPWFAFASQIRMRINTGPDVNFVKYNEI